MNNLASWMQQAKEVTKKFSEMMYIPAEDGDEPEKTITSDAESREVNDEMKNTGKATDAKAMENKENISANDPALESEGNDGSGDDGDGGQSIGGFDRRILEANAAAAAEAAKKYANSFFSLAKEATAIAATTAEETAKKLQNVVAEKTIIGNLDKEQAKFNEEVNANKLTMGTLPWSDLPDQWIAKKHILALSLDARNFTRDPPTETNFDFTHMQSVAAALLEQDPNLRKIRFQLVPKQLNEERFWRNYFYRVSLVRQSALGESGAVLPVAEDPVCSKDVRKEEEEEEDVKESIAENSKSRKEMEEKGNKSDNSKKISNKEQQNETEDEDNEETKDEKLKEIRETVANAAQKQQDEDWEKDLVNDFNDYELVTGQMDKTDEQWENEIAELLDST